MKICGFEMSESFRLELVQIIRFKIRFSLKQPIKLQIKHCPYLLSPAIHRLHRVKGPLYSRLYNMVRKNMDEKPEAPKKPLSAFFLYKKEVYNDVKSKHPDAKITEMTKIISEMWSKVEPSTKSRLEAQYQKNKAKHDEEKEAYEKKYGKIQRKKKKVTKKGA